VKKALLYENLMKKSEKADPANPETIALKIHKSIYMSLLMENNWISSCLQLTNYQNINSIICGILKDLFQSSNKLKLFSLFS